MKFSYLLRLQNYKKSYFITYIYVTQLFLNDSIGFKYASDGYKFVN